MSGGTNRSRRQSKGRAPAGQASNPAKGSASRRSSPARHRSTEVDFWGRSGESPPAGAKIRPTADPGALPSSLGDPPLGPNPAAAAHHLAVIYEEAVRAGTALAAANGLLEDEDEDPDG